jgi:hypothetical protein
VKQIQYAKHWLYLQLGKSHNSPHLPKKLIHRFITKTLYQNRICNLLWCTSYVPSTTNMLSLHLHRLHIFVSTSHIPPIDLGSKNFTKTSQNYVSPLCQSNPPQGRPCPPCGVTCLLDEDHPSFPKPTSEPHYYYFYHPSCISWMCALILL